MCDSADTCTSTAAIHMVSAFGTDSRLVLAQQKVVEKSNEITAIPALLDLLDVTGHTIMIDAHAMRCQRSIAKKIQDKGVDCVLALKDNQGTLNDDVRLFLETQAAKPASKAISDTYIQSDNAVCASSGRFGCARRVGVPASTHATRVSSVRQKAAWMSGSRTDAPLKTFAP